MSWSGFTKRAPKSAQDIQTQSTQDAPDMPFNHARIDLMSTFPQLDDTEATKFLEMVIDGPKSKAVSNDQLQEAKNLIANDFLLELTNGDTKVAGKYLHDAQDNTFVAYETAMKDKEFLFKLEHTLKISEKQAKSLHDSMVEYCGQDRRWDIDLAKKSWRAGHSKVDDDDDYRPLSKGSGRTGANVNAFVKQFTSVTGATDDIAHTYGKRSKYEDVELAINTFLDTQEYARPSKEMQDQFASGFALRANASELVGTRYGFKYNYNMTRLDEAVAEYRRRGTSTVGPQKDVEEHEYKDKINTATDTNRRVTSRTVITLTQATNVTTPPVNEPTGDDVAILDAAIEGFDPRYLDRWENTSREEQDRQIALSRDINSAEAWRWVVSPLPNTSNPTEYVMKIFQQSYKVTELALLNLTQRYGLHAYQEITGANEATAREHLRMSDNIRTAIEYGFPGRHVVGRMDVLIHQYECVRLTWNLRYQRLSQLRQQPDRAGMLSQPISSIWAPGARWREQTWGVSNDMTAGTDMVSSDPVAPAESAAGVQDGTVIDELAAAAGLIDIWDDPSLAISRVMFNEATESLL